MEYKQRKDNFLYMSVLIPSRKGDKDYLRKKYLDKKRMKKKKDKKRRIE